VGNYGPGFLTWNAITPRGSWNQYQGCWGRSNMWWPKVKGIRLDKRIINAIAIIAVFVLENVPSIWSRCTALAFTLSL